MAIKFRSAIEEAQNDGQFDLDSQFSRFPKGCCGDTAALLGQFFIENGIESYYVWGSCCLDKFAQGTQTHAWLLVDGLIVDITGNQFSDRFSLYYDKKVYVGTEDEFHNLFQVEKRNVYIFMGLEGYNKIYKLRLLEVYGKIKKYIKN